MKEKIRGIGIYIIILIVIIFSIAYMLAQNISDEILYSDLISYFDSKKIISFILNGNTFIGELSNNKIIKYTIPDIYIFNSDLGKIILQQQRLGIIKKFNYIYPAEESFIGNMLPYILILCLFGLFWYFIISKQDMGIGTGRSALNFGKARTKIVSEDEKPVTFQDVAGADEEKSELEEIVDFLKNSNKFISIGARIPKGVLLVGPPGTGKTLLARAVAGEASVPFLSISGSDFVELYVGIGASRVRDLFDQAKKTAPAIIFIDEIDAVGRHRGSGLGGGHDEREQTLNQLLVEMDGFSINKGIIILAATNRPDILDPALLRPGRFDRQIYVGAPDIKGREQILIVHSKNKPLSKDVNLKDIAKSTSGFTGADLENLLNESALMAAKNNRIEITKEDLEKSFLKVVMGTEKKSRVISDYEKKLTAYHEAGHAVTHKILPTQNPVHQISIIPHGKAGGFTMSLPQEDKYYSSKSEMFDNIITLLGGHIAEKIFMNDISTGASNDIERATSIAKSMVTRYGMSEIIGPINYSNNSSDVLLTKETSDNGGIISEKMQFKIDIEIRKIIEQAYNECNKILTNHIDILNEIASYLIKHEVMNSDKFEEMFVKK